MQGIVEQPAPPQHCLGSDVPRVRLSMQRTDKSPMGQDLGCRQSDPISPIRIENMESPSTPDRKDMKFY